MCYSGPIIRSIRSLHGRLSPGSSYIFARKLGMIVAATLACLVAADLAGVAASFFFDVFGSESRTSAAIYYAVWFVDGVFCGMLIYTSCGSFTSPQKKGQPMQRGDQGQTGLLVILTAAAILGGLSMLFYRFQWKYSRADSVYVPDSESLTLTFFFTIFASVIFAHKTLGPETYKKR